MDRDNEHDRDHDHDHDQNLANLAVTTSMASQQTYQPPAGPPPPPPPPPPPQQLGFQLHTAGQDGGHSPYTSVITELSARQMQAQLPPSGPSTGPPSNRSGPSTPPRLQTRPTLQSIPSNAPQSIHILPPHPQQRQFSVDEDTLSGAGHPLPPIPQELSPGGSRSAGILRNGPERHGSFRPRSGIDWIVPLEEKPPREKSVGERLDPTLITAMAERDKYALKAKMTGYALNAAIGMQVLLGALTTGLSAATTGRQTSISTAILGGLATIVASYLARARGSNEPELSITRVKDLEQFIRECEAFKMDCGHILGDKYDAKLESLRRRFEELLGNANGERRLAPPV